MKIPDKIIDQLKHPAVATVLVSWAGKLGQEVQQLQSGQIDKEEFKRRAKKHLALITGTTVGATIGSTIGGMVPKVGRLLGAFTGGLLGQMVGQHFGDLVVSKKEEQKDDPKPRTL